MNLLRRNFQKILFLISIFVHIFYYISAYFTQTLAPFFVWAATGGMDFFQIPNGAYAFLHGGSLTGILSSGVSPFAHVFCCSFNFNVYHPLFTLLVGTPLQLLPPAIVMGVWACVHLILMAILVFFLWKKFRHHKYLYLALSILLLFSYHYYEIWLAQYHFLFNFFTILFLYESVKHGDTKKAGVWLFLSLLVKPVGLLWIIPLLLYKRYKTVSFGFGAFAFATFLFTIFPFTFGQYYITNFLSVASAMRPSANLYAFQWIIPSFPMATLHFVGILLAIGLIMVQIIKKPSLFTIITLWSGYQLLFYGLVFHYHYTILAGIICLGILLDIFSPKRIEMIPIIFLTLPTPVVFFQMSDAIEPRRSLAYIWLYSCFWLCCLLGTILFKILKNSRHSLK
jgi:hypothetical protein